MSVGEVVIPDVTVDGVEVFVQPNGDVNIEVYGLLRFTVEHTPDGFACSLVADDGPVYTVTTYDTMEG